MNVRSFFVVLLFSLCGWMARAQYTEYGTWTGVKASYEATKRLDFSAEVETRIGGEFNRYNQAFLQVGGAYRINENLKAAVDYRFAHRNQGFPDFDFRNRVNTDLIFRIKPEKTRYDLRLRYTAARRNIDERGTGFAEALRMKAGVERKIIKRTSLDISGELFWRERRGEYNWSDWRFTAAVNRNLKKGRTLTVGYRVQREVNRRDPLLEHVLVLGYGFEVFRKKKKQEDTAP